VPSSRNACHAGLALVKKLASWSENINMFSKILIANRGEIACRVIHTARKLGIKTVAVYSQADENTLHVTQADEAIFIGPSASNKSYLVIDNIIAAALKTGAQAIHPGYGFLSENAEFAEACGNNNLVFIGPPVSAIKSMGSKSAAKNIMQDAGVPLVPGYHGDQQSRDILKHAADEMGYPVLLKAVAGGGGKGMRQVWSADEFDSELTIAKSEALSSFGNDDMLVEKYLTAPRHVEFQVFCDAHGNALHLFERDCTIQRRHQKVIEEAPAPNFSKSLRHEMGQAAIRAAQAINYQGAGTVEFLLGQDGSFYFMEMNTRLQVEHPVTEMISGQDLVEWQLRVANNEALPLEQSDLAIDGHAFEARIYAEDPSNDFLPTAGKLIGLEQPTLNDSVRIDTGVLEGDEVSPFYDPMIAKLIVWDKSRHAALAKLKNALNDYKISGITTNISFLKRLAAHPSFANADLDTGFIERHKQSLFIRFEKDHASLLPVMALFLVLDRKLKNQCPAWTQTNAWRLNQNNTQTLNITLKNKEHSITVDDMEGRYTIEVNEKRFDLIGELKGSQLNATIDGHKQSFTILKSSNGYCLFAHDQEIEFQTTEIDLGDHNDTASVGNFKAPMNGTIVELLVCKGDTVMRDQALIIIEAMKMQHTIKAPSDGTVSEVFYTLGDLVDGGAELLSFEQH